MNTTYTAKRASVLKRARKEQMKERLYFILAVPLTLLLGYLVLWTGYFVSLEVM